MPVAPLSSAGAAENADELSEDVPVGHGGTIGAIGCRATGEEEQGAHLVGEGAKARPDLGVGLAARAAPSPGACPSPPAPGGSEAQQPQAAPERAATSATSSAASPTCAGTAACLQESKRALHPTCGSQYVIGRFRLTACERLPLC